MLTISVNNSSDIQVEPDSNGFAKGLIQGVPYALDIAETGKGTLHILRDNRSYTVDVLETDDSSKTLLLKINGQKYRVTIKDQYDALLSKLGITMQARVVKELKAPMPGMVLSIAVNEGDEVKKDQPLLVLEAMKMENVLKAPADAVIKSVLAVKGQAVEKNQVLIGFE